ncbi:MAG: DUF3662 and FHA domain-containing protein [Actinomycetota bacterium]|jgi:hypothetical protein|nr:DUF3662 and FHA domain-containing protein [Actinomycetota bacterium]MDA8280674.1 DUF3662 and FHA domain-containing protein [Actinomycetota bacterium]
MGLQQFEQRLERLVEGAFTKAFRSDLQPVEIGRRLTREMDLLRRVGVNGLITPNVFIIELSADDARRFERFSEVLARELADAAREHARIEGYVFVGPVEVELRRSARLRAGRYQVYADFEEGPDGMPAGLLALADGTEVVIGSQPVVIGRLPECAVVLSDPNVSRRHAEVCRVDGGPGALVRDLGSTNGTRVNGVPIREQVLVDGDEVTVGTTVLRFHAG